MGRHRKNGDGITPDPQSTALVQDNIKKYLSRYAEPEVNDLQLTHGQYDHVVVIPAFDEKIELLQRLSADLDDSHLAIVVANCPETEDARSTARLAEQLAAVRKPAMMVVDRFSELRRIPQDQGVGLARKIGCDIALKLIDEGVIKDSWIFTTDADAQLPSNYFQIDGATKSASSAAVFPFRHEAAPELASACEAYELSMLYYAAGLKWAGSPYAFTTIGSTLAFSANHYAEVRGFPKRNTGEDFYILNKLRKIGPVHCLTSPEITIQGRLSDRVPVGTGRAIQRISEADSELTVEHPDCYHMLKITLDWMNELAESQPDNPASGTGEIDNLLTDNGFFEIYEKKQRQNPNAGVMRKHLSDWFDALKTRQFVHGLRDRYFGRVAITEIGRAPFFPDSFAEEKASMDYLTVSCRMQVFGA